MSFKDQFIVTLELPLFVAEAKTLKAHTLLKRPPLPNEVCKAKLENNAGHFKNSVRVRSITQTGLLWRVHT